MTILKLFVDIQYLVRHEGHIDFQPLGQKIDHKRILGTVFLNSYYYISVVFYI